MRPTVSSRRRAGVLYAGAAVVLLLAALTARSIWTAWQQRSGESRAEAIFELVEQRTPPRPTEAPGAMAWLRLELVEFGRHITDVDRSQHYRSLAAASDRAPEELRGALGALRAGLAAPDRAVPKTIAAASSTGSAANSIRRQSLVTVGDATLVVTRREALEASDQQGAASNRFIAAAAGILASATHALGDELRAHPWPATPASQPPRPVRLYAVSEDGTLISAPWDPARGDRAVVDRELTLLSARPGQPSFAPSEFFFRFPPAAGATDEAAYSGFYLDVGGRGLVSTVTMPFSVANAGRGVLALDLAFEVDWPAFTSAVEPPVVGAAITTPDASHASWSALESSLTIAVPATLRAAVSALASDERRTGAVDAAPLRHGLVSDLGAVAAFQVSDTAWLLMLFPRTSPAFPLAAVTLLGGMLVLLLGGFEFHRRRAEDERVKAERALEEKQNLLNTMQIPLVVVDPNTDQIVSSNLAAESLGIRGGSRFADLVSPDPRARAHYEKMQVASPQPRRAYGVPVNVRDEHGRPSERYAIVRSVAVTAPITALSADERHRLGVLFLVEPDADLALLVKDIDDSAHRDERRRLAGLLTHGVDTLARVLEHALSRPGDAGSSREFTTWLAEYLERRLTVTAWLLDHWDATPPLPRDSVVDAEQARVTIGRLASVFARVRSDRDLRARLHWDNGALSAASADDRVIDVTMEWPATFEFTVPVRGGFGLFIGEVLANAVRHGAPGSVPRVIVSADRIRKELIFEVENITAGHAASRVQGDSYGGLEILKAMARLFEWPDLAFDAQPGRFIVRWRIPASERAEPGHAD